MKPILFNTEMVKAILDGRKTTTRRIIKGLPDTVYDFEYAENNTVEFLYGICSEQVFMDLSMTMEIPYQIGDILWVRETWQQASNSNDLDQAIEGTERYLYRADNPQPFNLWIDTNTGKHKDKMPWRPSIFMPFEAARIFLMVTSVHIEKLQDITGEQAINEGVHPWGLKNEKRLNQWCKYTKMINPDAKEGSMKGEFAAYWDSITKKSDLTLYGWNANPYVWVIEFARIDKEDIPE